MERNRSRGDLGERPHLSSLRKIEHPIKERRKMALKKTAEKMKDVLLDISHNLDKAERGNKAAAQRVRKLSIEFGKIAKVYRKESVAEGKKGKKATKKRKTTAKKKVAKKKVAKKKAPARKKAVSKKTARRKTKKARR